jgi:hypothetical protein
VESEGGDMNEREYALKTAPAYRFVGKSPPPLFSAMSGLR